jgi:uncharacterized protein
MVLLAPGCWAASGDWSLLTAVRDDRPELVRNLLDKHADVNASTADGATALHWASHRDDLAIADLLIKAGAHVNAATDRGVTPLNLACVNGSAAMVQKLVTAGASAKATLPSGESALMTCSRSGNADAVKTLVSHGADVNASESSHHQTALMWAVSEKHHEVVRVLLDHGADVRARSLVWREFVLRASLVKGRSEGEWIDRGGSTPLLLAARSGDIESVGLLLGAGADPNDTTPDGYTPLLMAAHSRHGKLAEMLLERGANPNACAVGFTALHVAVLEGDLDLVKALLAHGADVNARLTNGAPLRRVDSDPVLPAELSGATPFLLAAKYVDVPIMRELIAGGAKPSIAMNDRATALMAAAGVGWAGGVDRRGANLIAAPASDEKDALEAVQLTIESSDVNAANEAGDTALHGAAAKGYNSIVQLLVDRGANLAAKNKKGQTPLAMTRTTKSSFGQVSLKTTADLLRKLGAVDEASTESDKAKKK